MSRAATNFLLLCSLLMANLCMACNRSSEQRPVNPDLHRHIAAYWDSIDVASLSKAELEQRLVDFIYITQHADSATRAESWLTLGRLFPAEIPNRTVTDYLGQSDSPLYAPEMLEEYLAATLAATPTDDPNHGRVKYLYDNVRKNKPGMQIADLNVTKTDGTHTTLHDILSGHAGGAVVLFYDPECENCAEAIAQLSGPQAPPADMQVVAVCISQSPKQLPSGWVSTTVDSPEQLDERFYLPTLPVVYTLAVDGRIVEKG